MVISTALKRVLCPYLEGKLVKIRYSSSVIIIVSTISVSINPSKIGTNFVRVGLIDGSISGP